MDVESLATGFLEHGEAGYQEVYQVASLLLDQLDGLFATGAYVRVKAGIRALTHEYPEATKLLTQHLSQEFAGDAFLTVQLQRNKCMDPHKDTRNSALPTLFCNLSPGAPGGTWVEDTAGDVMRLCPDGIRRPGRILEGKRYRLSARLLWHATAPADQDRILLLGWVPAGWRNISQEDLNSLKMLGFNAPTEGQDARGHLSLWKGSTEIQKDLEAFGFASTKARLSIWPVGVLNVSSRETHICLSSDEEDDVISVISET